MDWGQMVPVAMSVLGTALKAGGERSAGQSENKLAQYQAAQLRQNAGQAEATGSILAAAEAKKYRLAQSRALALAAASGGSAVDPTVIKIMADLAGAGSTATRTQLFNASEQARGMRDQAAATEYGGALAMKAANTKALGTILSGAKSIYDMVGGGSNDTAGGLNIGADSAAYEGTWTSSGSFDSSTYSGQIWD